MCQTSMASKYFSLPKNVREYTARRQTGEREEAVQGLKQAVEKHIFAEDPNLTFAVLDGAAIPDLREQLHALEPRHECLYMGDLEPDMAEVAPYLVQLEPNSDFANWV